MLIRGRTLGQVALAVIYSALALNAWAQVILAMAGRLADPLILMVLQGLIGIAGLAAAWGSWGGTRWAPTAAIGHGIVTAAMFASLTPLLGLGADARSGLWIAAAVVLALDSLFAWYLYRLTRRRGVT